MAFYPCIGGNSSASDYTYYYVNLWGEGSNQGLSVPIPDTNKLFKEGFNDYDFEILLNCIPNSSSSSESCVLGMYGGTASNAAIEFYFISGVPHLMLRKVDSNSSSGKYTFDFNQDISNKDIIIKKEGSNFTVSVDGEVVYSSTYNVTNYANDGRLIRFGNYQTQYYFNGVIKKAGFKWL